MTIKTDIEITNWPVLPAKETNRQRIVRALREADGVVEQCRGYTANGDARCATDVVYDLYGIEGKSLGDGLRGFSQQEGSCFRRAGLHRSIWWLNDQEGLTFAEIAHCLEQDDSYWGPKADEEFAG